MIRVGGILSSAPEKPIDTDRFFVICPNLLGGCRGSTGPGSINPEHASALRTVISQPSRLETWSKWSGGCSSSWASRRLLAVVGGSVGGHQALTWAIRHPDAICGSGGPGDFAAPDQPGSCL